MTLAIHAPAALALDFAPMSPQSTRPPWVVPRADFAPELAATIAERRAFNDRMVAKHSMSRAEADQDLAILVDLALDLAAPLSWPRPDAACRWADKAAELRRILTHRRKAWPQPVDPANRTAAEAMETRRIEAIEGLHWTMTIGLGWCDAFDAIATRAQCEATIRAWTWAIEQHERRAADAGEPWARPDRSTAGRAAWLAANPAAAAGADALEITERAAALELGIAVMERAA